MSPSSASNFSPTSISIGKKHLKTLLTFFWIAEVKKTFLGLHFQSKLVKANLDSALLGKGISVPRQ